MDNDWPPSHSKYIQNVKLRYVFVSFDTQDATPTIKKVKSKFIALEYNKNIYLELYDIEKLRIDN